MPLDCTIDSAALLKILLHAAKYPASPINGLLIGAATQPASSSDTADNVGGSSLQITDVVPLFHSFLHLSMPLETALVQVNAWAESRSLQVVGVYHANERLDDKDLGPGPRKIADKLQQQCSPVACGLLVDNQRLGSFLRGDDTSFLELYTRPPDRGGWSAAASSGGGMVRHGPGDVPRLYADLVAQQAHRRLSDWDDHLDDLGRDWTNQELLS